MLRWRCEDLFERVDIAELRVGVIHTVIVRRISTEEGGGGKEPVSMVYPCNFSEIFRFCAVFLHIFDAGVAEYLSCQRTRVEASGLRHDLITLPQRRSMFRKLILQGPYN